MSGNLHAKYATLKQRLANREVFDEEINNVRARSLAIAAAVEEADREKKSRANNTKPPASPAKPSSPTPTLHPTSHHKSPGKTLNYPSHLKRRMRQIALEAGEEESYDAFKGKMQTPYFTAERRFIDDLSTTVEEGVKEASVHKPMGLSTMQAGTSKVRQIGPAAMQMSAPKSVGGTQPVPSLTPDLDGLKMAPIGRANRDLAVSIPLESGGRPMNRSLNQSFHNQSVNSVPEEVPYVLSEASHPLVPVDPSPVSGILQKAMEHIRYPEAETNLRGRLKSQYVESSRSNNVVDRYFSTLNINPSAVVGIGSLTGATNNRSPSRDVRDKSTSAKSSTMDRSWKLGHDIAPQMRKPGAAPIADGTAQPRFVTATVDFNALHEEAFLKQHQEAQRAGKEGGGGEMNPLEGVPPASPANTQADAMYSRLNPEALIRGAESSHRNREKLRTNTDSGLSLAEGKVLTGALRSAHEYRPGARGGHATQFDEEGDEANGQPMNHRSRAELKEAIERSNALRAIFAGESDSDDDRGDDTAKQNEEDLPRTGVMRRAAREKATRDLQQRAMGRRAHLTGEEATSQPPTPQAQPPSSQDTIEDLCDLLECSIICFCEYINRSTVLGGDHASGEAGYEGPPRDISILRSILIHSLSSSLPQLKQALGVLEAIQFGTSGVHTMILEDPLNISAVAASGGLAASTTATALSASGTQATTTRISAALKTILRERQQELRYRLFRSWTKAFEVLLALDLKHDRSASSVLKSLAARAGIDSLKQGSIQSVVGSATTVGHPEGFTVHNDGHMRKAAAYYCSIHRTNEQRREHLLSLWRDNKKKYDSALLQGRPMNPFHMSVPKENEKESQKGANDGYVTPQVPDLDAEATEAQKHEYRPYPLDLEHINSISPEQARTRQLNRSKIEQLVEYFITTKKQLTAEDLSLLDFNSANIVFKQQQLASAFLDKLLPKILGSIEYRSSLGGVQGTMATADLLSKQHEALRPTDKFKRVLLRYANLAGHGSEKGAEGDELPIEYIDEMDGTRMDKRKVDSTGDAHDMSLSPQGTRLVGEDTIESRLAANPVNTAKLLSVFRSSWGRSTLSPEVSEAEAVIRSSVLEDSLLISCMDAYFHLIAEPLQKRFQQLVKEEKQYRIGVEAAAAEASIASGKVSSHLHPASTEAKDGAKEALQHTTRMQLLDQYNAMDAAKSQQFAALAQSRKNAADKLRNRHVNDLVGLSGTPPGGSDSLQPVALKAVIPLPLPSPQQTSIDPHRLKDLQKLLQSTDSWFGYEKGRQATHKSLMIGAGFGNTLGVGPGSAGSRRTIVGSASSDHSPPSPNKALNASGALHASNSSLRRPSSQQGALFNDPPPPIVAPDPSAVAATATINRSRAEVLRLNKLHQLQACWTALSIHYIHKLTLHDKWNSTEKDAKTLDKTLSLYKEAAISVLSREAVLEAITKNEKKLAHLGSRKIEGGGAFLNKAFTSPNSRSNHNLTSNDRATDVDVGSSEAMAMMSQLQATNTNLYGGGASPDQNSSANALASNPVLEALRDIAAAPTTGNPRRDCELARHRLFSELTTCSQRCDVIARRLLNETGDELLFKGGPYLLKMKEDYNQVRELVRADGRKKF